MPQDLASARGTGSSISLEADGSAGPTASDLPPMQASRFTQPGQFFLSATLRKAVQFNKVNSLILYWVADSGGRLDHHSSIATHTCDGSIRSCYVRSFRLYRLLRLETLSV